MSSKEHWETIFKNKALDEVSWYEPTPSFSIDLFRKHASDTSASILNIGGGDSLLFDYLVKEGYNNLHLLDISATAIARAKRRLQHAEKSIKYINTDITDFNPLQTYNIWFDRAAFHFLTDARSVEKYVNVLKSSTDSSSIIIIGTFSKNGPIKCSGIDIQQYDEIDFRALFGASFDVLEVINTDHETPSGKIQNFNFVVMKKAVTS